jgi:2-C-methyl-D-erythritol 4-phosphate cytidylyltransferase
MKKVALIVAGGMGSRMGHDIPKQFLELAGKPILMHTIEKFRHICSHISVVLPSEQFQYWKKLCEIHHFSIPHNLVEGGKTRLESVFNGLESINEDCLIAIHDGVRPLIDEQIITNSFEQAEIAGNAIVSVNLKDTIREIVNGSSKAQMRENFVLVQTPQTFRSITIKNVYSRLMKEVEERSRFTDDASVAEFFGEKINLIEGNYTNIKITTSEDLKIAGVLMK